MTLAIGKSGLTPGIASVMNNWWRVGTTGSVPPRRSAMSRDHAPAAREGGGSRGSADLAGEPGRAGGRLGGEPGALEQRHPETVPGQVIRDARAEGARADYDCVRRVDHRPGPGFSRGACRAA